MFTRKEQQYVELQSVNTGHCWNIFENQFEQTNKIKLYHKHKEANAYYHQHRLCRIVAEAISNIKEHRIWVCYGGLRIKYIQPTLSSQAETVVLMFRLEQ